MATEIHELTGRSASFDINGEGLTLHFLAYPYISIAHTATTLGGTDRPVEPNPSSGALGNFTDLTLGSTDLIDESRWHALLHDADSLAMLEEMANAALADDDAGLTWDVDELL